MKRIVLATVVTTGLVAVGSAFAAGNTITVNPAAPTTTSGVSFSVTIQGGNRSYASVGVSCESGYATVLTVTLDANGAGTSQSIYPPAGSCTATLEKLQSITHSRILATAAFTVT
jgi:hypothetical protein